MRYYRILRFINASLVFCGLPLVAESASVKLYDGPKEKLHAYLLIGDSTMAGTAELSDEQAKVLERCYLLNKEGKWEQARAPLNRYSTVIEDGDVQKLGPGYSFAAKMLEKNKDISIGLVVNAAKGTKLEDWHRKSEYYRGARGRGKIALSSGTMKGILWHHSGSSLRTFRIDELKGLVARLRTFLGMDLPIVVGEVPKDHVVNNLMAAFAADIHASAVASAQDLAADDVQKLGERYAEQMMALQASLAKKEIPKPRYEIPVIDTHIHVHANKVNGLDLLSKWMEKNNVLRTIVHPLPPSRAKDEKEREIMLENYEKYKGKIYRFCLIEPDEVSTVEDAVKILRKEKAEGAIGFGEHYGRDMMFDDPANMRLYAACEKVGLPVMFHIDQNKNMDENGLPRVERVLKEFPGCVLIAHAQWWGQLSNGTCERLLRDYPNIYGEISAQLTELNRERGYTRDFLIRNADRILFGSDEGWWSIGDKRSEEPLITLLESLDLPEEVRNKIYKGNAEKLFNF